MSKLEQLIEELCPEGVEYKAVGELIIKKIISVVTPTVKIKRNEYKEKGTIPIVSQEIEFISGYCELPDKNIPNGNYVCFGDHSEHMKYINFAFTQGADGLKIMRSNEQWLLSRFLYYAISSFYIRHNNYERHFKYLTDTVIPVPPLPVQEEIVRILDTFTALTAELQAELQARRKQYEYYKHHLLSSGDDIVELRHVATYVKKRISASDIDENTYVGVDNLLQNCAGKVPSTHVPVDGNLIAYQPNDIMIGNIRPYLKKIWLANNSGGTNGDVLTVRVKNSELVAPDTCIMCYHPMTSSSTIMTILKVPKCRAAIRTL